MRWRVMMIQFVLITGICFNTLLALAASKADDHFMTGQIYAKQKEYDKAISEYLQALVMDPKYGKAHISLGVIYGIKKQHKRAIEAFKAALKLDPKSYLAYKGLGLVYKEIKQKKEAVEAFEAYLQYAPKPADDAKMKERKEIEQLIAQLKEALKAEPTPQPVATVSNGKD